MACKPNIGTPSNRKISDKYRANPIRGSSCNFFVNSCSLIISTHSLTVSSSLALPSFFISSLLCNLSSSVSCCKHCFKYCFNSLSFIFLLLPHYFQCISNPALCRSHVASHYFCNLPKRKFLSKP